jgi:hypothetical protein
MSPAIVRTIWRPIQGVRAAGPVSASRGSASRSRPDWKNGVIHRLANA